MGVSFHESDGDGEKNARFCIVSKVAGGVWLFCVSTLNFTICSRYANELRHKNQKLDFPMHQELFCEKSETTDVNEQS